MKINGNCKDHSPTKTKAAETVGKQAIVTMENIKVRNFDPAKTWLKISERLNQTDKRLLTWGLAMAASFSLLIAANVNIFKWRMPDKSLFLSNTQDHSSLRRAQETPPSVARNLNALPEFNIKRVGLNEKNLLIKKQHIQPAVSSPDAKRKNHAHLSKTETLKIPALSNPFVSGFAKVSVMQEGILLPEIGIDFKLGENYTAKRREIYKLGISSQFNFRTDSESGKKIVLPFAFLNFEYTSLNKHTNRGWTSRAGYLLNPDGYLYQDTTIKLSLFRNIGKRFKVGPEVILSNCMQRIYPGISLILG